MIYRFFILVFIIHTAKAYGGVGEVYCYRPDLNKSFVEKQTFSFSTKPLKTTGFSMSTILQGMSIGAGIGMMIPYTDLAPYRFVPKPSQLKTHAGYGFTAYLDRDIKWGLGARVQLHSGQLKGQRKTDIEQVGPLFAFHTKVTDVSLMVRFDLTDVLFKPDNENKRRLYMSMLAGGGVMFYRSYSYYESPDPRWVYNAYGYEVSESVYANSYQLNGKDKQQIKFYVPTMLRVGYRYNYKTDIHIEAAMNHTFVDNLDAFDRSFSANDKYAYFGLGITYNFERSEEDLKIEEKKSKGETTNANGEIDDIKVAKRRGILGRIFYKDRKDETLDMQLKLYETQLKMLELQEDNK